jgi:L-rhamnose mutarotase
MRVCFLLKIRPGMEEEYVHRHKQVWPDMVQALNDAGWQNYSLFKGEGGLIVGYFETSDFERAQAAMRDHPANIRWQSEMDPLLERVAGHDERADLVPLAEVFHLG